MGGSGSFVTSAVPPSLGSTFSQSDSGVLSDALMAAELSSFSSAVLIVVICLSADQFLRCRLSSPEAFILGSQGVFKGGGGGGGGARAPPSVSRMNTRMGVVAKNFAHALRALASQHPHR